MLSSVTEATELLASADAATVAKIAPALAKELSIGSSLSGMASDSPVTFLVYLQDQADVDAAARDATAALRKRSVVDALQETASASQAPLLDIIERQKQTQHIQRCTSYWIFNGFAIEGDLQAALALAERPEVASIRVNRVHRLPDQPKGTTDESLDSDLWNITKINVQQVWQTYRITGEGVVVANMDSGVDWTHPALQQAYRGYDAADPSASEHDYNWFDPTGTYPSAPGPTEAYAGSESDHGTHTMGTIVGAEPDGSQTYGVAPGAQWIATKAFDDDGYSSDEWIHACFQWLLAPTDLNGENPDPSRAPDIVSNSWGNDNGGDIEFAPDLAAWKAAGILSAWAGGNEGPGAGTINAPGAIPGALSVGATTSDDSIAYFSSRGPSTYGEIKPDVSAPGASIMSTLAGDRYGSWQGTSMATPHVAGLAALLMQAADHTLTITETQYVITSTVVDLGTPGKDNEFGYGRIDALAAVEYIVASGTLAGTVRDSSSGEPVQDATVSMFDSEGSLIRTCSTNSLGEYRTRIPEGMVDVSASAFGYYTETVTGVTISPDDDIQLDFQIDPTPRGVLSLEIVRAQNGQPAPATVTLSSHTAEQLVDSSGLLTWSLPVGTYHPVVRPAEIGLKGVALQEIEILEGETLSVTVELEEIPTILIVHGDAWLGENALPYYQASLDDLLYGYDICEPTYRYDVPTLETLSAYDVVIWSNSSSSPGYMSGWDDLGAYLDAGGSLLISGQDIGYWDDDGTDSNLAHYLHAELVDDNGGHGAVTPLPDGPWEGVALEIHGDASAMNQVSPDSIAALDALAQPIAAYPDGSTAVLAIDACAYRAIYVGFGLEGAGPGEERVSAIEQSIAWLAQPPTSGSLGLALSPSTQTVEPGQTASAGLSILNRTTAQTDLIVSANAVWPMQILDETGEPVTVIHALNPCSFEDLVVQLTVPESAMVGEMALATVTVTPTGQEHLATTATMTVLAQSPWEAIGLLDHPIVRAASTADGCRILVAGGSRSGSAINTFWSLDSSTGETTELASVPISVSQAAAALCGDSMYLIGGYDDALATTLDAVQVYDTHSNTWRAGPSLPVPVSGASATAVGTRVLVFGGTDGFETTATAYALKLGEETWEPIAPLPEACAYGQAVAHEGMVYLAGGWPDQDHLWRYDPSHDTWAALAPMSGGRHGFVLGSDGGYLYAAGGGSSWQGLGLTERYDPALDTWITLASMQDSYRAGACGGIANGRLIVISGTGPYDTTSIEMLDVGVPLAHSTLTADPETVQSGHTITYTLTLKNPSPEPVASAFTVTLPDEVTMPHVDRAMCLVTEEPQMLVTWADWVSAKTAETFQITAIVEDGVAYGTEIVAEAQIAGVPCADEDLGLNAKTTLVEPSLHASTATADRETTWPGSTIGYAINVINVSPFETGEIQAVTQLPARVELLPSSLDGAAYDEQNRTIQWQGSLEVAGAPSTLEWRDATDGENLALVDDSCSGELPLGFEFSFYDEVFDAIYVSSNGLVQFGGCDDAFANEPLPTTAVPYGFVAPFWDDLNPSSIGGVYFDVEGSAPHRIAVVSWESVPPYGSTEVQTFQVLLYEGSNGIVCQYRDMTGSRGKGASATVGIQSPDGSEAEMYLHLGGPDENSLHDGLIIVLDHPSTAWGTSYTYAFQTQVHNPMATWDDIVCTTTIADGLHVFTRVVTTSLVAADIQVDLPLINK